MWLTSALTITAKIKETIYPIAEENTQISFQFLTYNICINDWVLYLV